MEVVKDAVRDLGPVVDQHGSPPLAFVKAGTLLSILQSKARRTLKIKKWISQEDGLL
jgi:hypothetical protein